MNFIKNALIMIELEMRRLMHDKTEMYTRMVQPILWLVVFGPIMSAVRSLPTKGVPYTDFIMPGVLVQSAVFVSIFYGLNMVWERESGILKKLLVTPMSKFSIVAGRSMASGIRSVFQVILIVPFALAVGVKLVPNILFLTSAFVVIFLSSGGFAAVSILVASFFKTRDKLLGIGQAIVFPLFFLSSALYPIEVMPPLFKQITVFNPMTYVVDATRNLMITGDLTNILMDFIVIIAFDLVMFSLASINFKKIIE